MIPEKPNIISEPVNTVKPVEFIVPVNILEAMDFFEPVNIWEPVGFFNLQRGHLRLQVSQPEV